ncbi:MAG TPA: dolichyl-phosphate beta-glucosyltransferase [Nitrospira sp.]|jgi:dolichyl-phosphate beta-glucosyltransferase|nr:dolichyl-phosphate beta-glucosyltransferase [Nitrospira sp.]
MFSSHHHGSPELSIVIPAHNEAGRILPYLEAITDYCETERRSYEVLVVDDGSTDDTSLIVKRFATVHSAVQILTLPVCKGKGAAVRHGMQAAAGCLQLFADADGATPIRELAWLEKALAEGADIAIGSRAMAARLPEFTVRARVYRSVLGSLFNAAVQHSGIPGISDTQCGFKLFRRAVAQELFGYVSINGFGFDLELLYLARQRGYRIAEVPVNWSDQPGSKVRVLRDGLAMLRDLTVIRRNHVRGRYALPSFSPELMQVGASRFRMPAS